MTVLRNLLLLGALALPLTVAVSVSPALSKDEPITKPETAKQPIPRELQKSTDRGLYSSDLPVPGVGATVVPGAAAVMKAPVVPAKTTVVQPKRTTTTTAGAGTKSTKQVVKVPQTNGKKLTKAKPVTAAKKPTAGEQTASLGTDPNLVPVSHTSGGELVVSARLNKSGGSPHYKVGEKLEITVGASADCTLVVFDYDSTGTLTQIFPNDFQQDNVLKAGESVVIGGPDSKFDYEIGGKGGEEKIFVYAYPTTASQSPLSVAFNPPAEGSPFRAAPMTLEQYKELVNKSKVFFARSVKVVPKGPKPVSASVNTSAPNKLELTFQVEGK